MSKKKKKDRGRYDVASELTAGAAFLVAANAYLDVADIAFVRGDTDTLMEVGDRIFRLGAIMAGIADAGEIVGDGGAEVDEVGDEKGDARAKIGFVQ